MGKWKGDSNPGGPGGRTQRIRSQKGAGAHKKGCAVTALAIGGTLLVGPAYLAYHIARAVL